MIKTYRSNSGHQLKFSDEYKSYSFTKNNSGEWETSGEDYVGRLQVVLGSSCKMYKSGESEYPRFNPNNQWLQFILKRATTIVKNFSIFNFLCYNIKVHNLKTKGI